LDDGLVYDGDFKEGKMEGEGKVLSCEIFYHTPIKILSVY